MHSVVGLKICTLDCNVISVKTILFIPQFHALSTVEFGRHFCPSCSRPAFSVNPCVHEFISNSFPVACFSYDWRIEQNTVVYCDSAAAPCRSAILRIYSGFTVNASSRQRGGILIGWIIYQIGDAQSDRSTSLVAWPPKFRWRGYITYVAPSKKCFECLNYCECERLKVKLVDF